MMLYGEIVLMIEMIIVLVVLLLVVVLLVIVMEKKKKDMTAQFESQKAKVDAMPEVKEMLKMQEQMKSAVKEYDSSVPRMKAQLPKMKEVRDKKAKKDKFVAQNKAKCLEYKWSSRLV